MINYHVRKVTTPILPKPGCTLNTLLARRGYLILNFVKLNRCKPVIKIYEQRAVVPHLHITLFWYTQVHCARIWRETSLLENTQGCIS